MSNTVTYDVVVSMTIEIDADDLIDESARDILECSLDYAGNVDLHDFDITSA